MNAAKDTDNPRFVDQPPSYEHLVLKAQARAGGVELPSQVSIYCGWGRVINIASVAGLSGAKYVAAYSATKHAVIGFTRSLAAEVAHAGVTVNAVCPGYVDTDMTRASIAQIMRTTGLPKEAALEAILALSPQHRLLQPEEVAHAVTALCDAEARGINGQAIVIDGGALLA